jgi:hypothetical protein
VRNLVHVATPNAGTVLASQQRLTDLLDAFTNAFASIPDIPAMIVIDAVLEVVKQMAVGALGGLGGLTPMDPADPQLASFNDMPPAGTTQHYAVTSNYEPIAGASLRAIVRAHTEVGLGIHAKPSRLTVRAFLETWLAGMEEAVKPTTLRSYQDYIAAYVIPHIGQRKLQDIDIPDGQHALPSAAGFRAEKAGRQLADVRRLLRRGRGRSAGRRS